MALFTALTADAPTEIVTQTVSFADAFITGSVTDLTEATIPLDAITVAVAEATTIEAAATALGLDEQTTSIITAVVDLAAGNTAGFDVGLELNETALD